MLFTKNPKTKAGEVAQWLNTRCPSRGLGVLFPALTVFQVSGTLTPSSGLHRHPDILTHTLKNII